MLQKYKGGTLGSPGGQLNQGKVRYTTRAVTATGGTETGHRGVGFVGLT